jgi:hypothetical protein
MLREIKYTKIIEETLIVKSIFKYLCHISGENYPPKYLKHEINEEKHQ